MKKVTLTILDNLPTYLTEVEQLEKLVEEFVEVKQAFRLGNREEMKKELLDVVHVAINGVNKLCVNDGENIEDYILSHNENNIKRGYHA